MYTRMSECIKKKSGPGLMRRNESADTALWDANCRWRSGVTCGSVNPQSAVTVSVWWSRRRLDVTPRLTHAMNKIWDHKWFCLVYRRAVSIRHLLDNLLPVLHSNPLTAGAAYSRVFIFYQAINYQILNKVKIKCDINQQDLKRVDPHFVKSE